MANNVTWEPVSSTSGAIPQGTITETEQQGDGSQRQIVKVGASALPDGASTGAKQDTLLTELQLKADLTETQPVQIEKVIGVVSTENSTTTPLGIGGVFTGTGEDVANYKNIGVIVKASHASATDGLKLQFSIDNTWESPAPDSPHNFTIPAATGRFFNIPVEAKYFRIVYTNGAVAQTYLRLQTIYHATTTKESTLRLSEDVDAETAASLVRAVLAGQVNGTLVNVRLDRATGILPTITGDHNHIHNHEMFTASYVIDAANAAVVDLLIVTPNTTTWAHMYILIDTESEADYKFYGGTTASNNGTSITSFDRNRNTPVAATTLVFHTPTVAGGSEGTLMQVRHWGSGKGVGGGGREAEEWELNQNTKYLMRITNATAVANQISVLLNWYEHEDIG